MIPHLRLQQKSIPGCIAGDWTLHDESGAIVSTLHRFKGYLVAARQMLGKWNTDGKGMNILRAYGSEQWKDWLMRQSPKNPVKHGAEALLFLPHYKKLVVLGTFAPYNANCLTLAGNGYLYGFRGDFRFTNPRPSYTIAMEKLELPVNLRAMPEGWGDVSRKFQAGEVV